MPCLADPGEARGRSTNTVVSDSVHAPLSQVPLKRHQALTVRDTVTNPKIDYEQI